MLLNLTILEPKRKKRWNNTDRKGNEFMGLFNRQDGEVIRGGLAQQRQAPKPTQRD